MIRHQLLDMDSGRQFFNFWCHKFTLEIDFIAKSSPVDSAYGSAHLPTTTEGCSVLLVSLYSSTCQAVVYGSRGHSQWVLRIWTGATDLRDCLSVRLDYQIKYIGVGGDPFIGDRNGFAEISHPEPVHNILIQGSGGNVSGSVGWWTTSHRSSAVHKHDH